MGVWLTRLRLRVRAMVSRSHDRELRDELQLHLDLLADEYRAQGLSPEEARVRAHQEFGNATRVQEASHDLFSFGPLERAGKDVVYALREMRRSPGFTAVAVLSLAVGIGAVTTTFAVIDAFMLRGLSVPEPDRLVAFSASNTPSWSTWSTGAFRGWAESPGAPFDAAAVYTLNPLEQPRLSSRDGEPTAPVRVSLVSSNYFDVLGAPIARGRTFGSFGDRTPGAQPIAVISDAFWRRQFGRADDVVGRSIELNGVLYEILGVARRDFTGEWIGQPTDVWLPLSMHPSIVRARVNLLSDDAPARWLRVIARLHDGVTKEQAQVSASTIYQRFAATQPARPGSGRAALESVALLTAATGYAPERQYYAQPVMILSVIVALVLVIACANFTNLLLARSESRQQEFAVRLALGAGRWRIVRQSLTECVLLAAVAGGLGLLASAWGTTAALRQLAEAVQPVDLDLRLDARALAFTAACAALVILFGAWPCVRGPRTPALQRLSLGPAGQRRTNVVGRVMLVAQLTLCVVLLIGTGLLLRTVVNLRSQALGFDRNVLLVTLLPARAGYTEDAGEMLLQRVRERLSAIHGIVSVSTTPELLDSRAYWIDGSERLSVDGQEAVAGVRWTFADVGPGFFETLGVPLVNGRTFDDRDFHSSSDAIVINKTMATMLFGERDAIGHRIGMTPTAPPLIVVGVVNDMRQVSPRDAGTAVIYRPLRGTPPRVVLAVRTHGPAAESVDVVKHQLESMDGHVPVTGVRTIDEQLDEAIAQERLMSTLASWLGALVIVVACVGLHALIAYDVAQRTHEIGVRLAMGATRAAVARLVVHDCAWLVAVGIAIGVPVGLAAVRPLSSQLYGLRTYDPLTTGAVIGVLTAVTLVAAVRPARSAARTDPVALLRAT